METANNDLANLLSSTDIATIFLDDKFRIKRFTPAATRLVNLIPSDLGRPLADIARKVIDDDLLENARDVLEKLVPVEKEVRAPAVALPGGPPAAAHERWYSRRILPYRTRENRIEASWVTFVEVTPLRQAVEQTRQQAAQQAMLANLVLRALKGEEPATLLNEASRAVAEALGVELVGVFCLEPDGSSLAWRRAWAGNRGG